VMRSVTRLLTTRLKLRVNSEKSAVARPWERKFLGFSFTNRKLPKRRLAPKSVVRFKERVRELTRRTRGISLAQMDRLLRTMRNSECARRTGAMGPPPTSVDGLETMETGNHEISRAPQARRRCAGGRENSGQLRWTVAPCENPSAKPRSIETPTSATVSPIPIPS
jgi:hypothetical protein